MAKEKFMSVNEMRLTIERMNDTICELKAANVKLSEDNNNLCKLSEEMDSKIKTHMEYMVEQDTELAHLRMENIGMSKEIANLTKQNDYAVKEMSRLRKMYNETEDELGELKTDYRLKCEDLRARESTVDKFKRLNLALVDELDQVKQSLNDMTSACNARDNDNRKLREMIEDRSREITTIKASLASTTRSLNEATAKLSQMQGAIIAGEPDELVRQANMIKHLRSELECERKNHENTENKRQHAERIANECEMYRQFYRLLRGLNFRVLDEAVKNFWEKP